MSEEATQRTEPFYMAAEGTDLSAVWSVFGGHLNVSVLARKGGFVPGKRITINRDVLTIIKRYIEKMRDAGPGTHLPICVNRWDENTKKSVRHYIITLVKDDSRVYYFEIDFGDGKHVFAVGKLRNITLGTDPLKDAEQSSIKLESFYRWLTETVPVERVITNLSRPNDGGGRPQGGQNYKSGNRPPKRDVATAPSEPKGDGEWDGDIDAASEW